ncbi:MAG: hypothetical protein KBD67_01655 [Anaerolineaceae bacterium]|nr:hypothetical protein [Anaerolineaceae bacterium]
MSQNTDGKAIKYLIGGAVGLLTGLAAAYLIINNEAKTGESLKLTSSNGAKIGLGIVTLLRLISDTGKKRIS